MTLAVVSDIWTPRHLEATYASTAISQNHDRPGHKLRRMLSERLAEPFHLHAHSPITEPKENDATRVLRINPKQRAEINVLRNDNSRLAACAIVNGQIVFVAHPDFTDVD